MSRSTAPGVCCGQNKAARNARIIDLVDQGLTEREVACELGLSRWAVKGVIQRSGGHLRPQDVLWVDEDRAPAPSDAERDAIALKAAIERKRRDLRFEAEALGAECERMRSLIWEADVRLAEIEAELSGLSILER